MTNLWLAVLSTVLTLAILGALWFHYRRVTTCLNAAAFALASAVHQTERSLRSHVVDEVNGLEEHTASLAGTTLAYVAATEQSIINYVKEHAEDLRKHAEDLRNHAKELTDRAEVQSAVPRQAVTRT